MSAILNALIGELTEAGRLMLNLSKDDAPFDIQFEQNGRKYVMVVRELHIPDAPIEEEHKDVEAEVVDDQP
nr:MAG TPA: hypothetical protein [Bacteriophage sp.]